MVAVSGATGDTVTGGAATDCTAGGSAATALSTGAAAGPVEVDGRSDGRRPCWPCASVLPRTDGADPEVDALAGRASPESTAAKVGPVSGGAACAPVPATGAPADTSPPPDDGATAGAAGLMRPPPVRH
jgi:hypothetical protein